MLTRSLYERVMRNGGPTTFVAPERKLLVALLECDAGVVIEGAVMKAADEITPIDSSLEA